MFNAHNLLIRHYIDNIRLGRDRRSQLAKHRDANLARVKAGLVLLSGLRKRTFPPFIRSFDQGGYAMHTLNQHPDSGYDIDTGIVFAAADLPTTALAARQLVADALSATGGNLTKEPEARTNAVTVWYAEGHHVDLAIYREKSTLWGLVLEHAGSDWVRRNPADVTEWFSKATARLSPRKDQGASVDADQFRRIVRYMKAFARSRASWSLPGGMIISALVAESYRPDAHRDDQSLFSTMSAIRDRLHRRIDVDSPVDSLPLTSKAEYTAQVERLREKLNLIIPKMEPLFRPDCNERLARTAWNCVFMHEFWSSSAASPGKKGDHGDATTAVVRVNVGVTGEQGDPVRWQYKAVGPRIPKGMWLRFSLDTVPVAPPFDIHWVVHNSGDEAAAAGDLRHETVGPKVYWQHARYKGDHKILCELRRNGSVLARGERTIRVSGT